MIASIGLARQHVPGGVKSFDLLLPCFLTVQPVSEVLLSRIATAMQPINYPAKFGEPVRCIRTGGKSFSRLKPFSEVVYRKRPHKVCAPVN
jgi:hypothetical protein